VCVCVWECVCVSTSACKLCAQRASAVLSNQIVKILLWPSLICCYFWIVAGVHAHTQAHTHTHTHRYFMENVCDRMLELDHLRTHSHLLHVHKHTHIHTQIQHIFKHTHMHTRTHTHTHTHRYLMENVCDRMLELDHLRTHSHLLHVHKHTHIHTQIHTHI